MKKITQAELKTLRQKKAGTVIRCGEIRGFQARLGANGEITFRLEYRFGIGRNSSVKRMTLGRLGAMTLDQARRRALDLLAEIRLGADPAGERSKLREQPRLCDYAETMLDEAAKIADRHPERAKLRPKTISYYRSMLRHHLRPRLAGRQFNQVTRSVVARMHNDIGVEQPATANRCVKFISTIWKNAADDGIVRVEDNPASGIKAFKEHNRERFLSQEELRRLGDALRIAETDGIPWTVDESKPTAKHIQKRGRFTIIDPHAAAAIRLLIFTGARLREILHARWSQIDFDRSVLSVYSKTGPRPILLPPPAMAILAQLPRDGEYVFPGTDKSRPRADLNRPWRQVRAFAGLEDLRIHDLRHSFASVAVAAGSSLPLIGKLLGHANPDTTARYAHLSADPVREAADRTAASIAAAMAGDSATIVQLKSAAERKNS